MWPWNADRSKPDNFSLERARSRVRISVTYIAAGFLFLGGGAFIVVLLLQNKTDDAIELFNIIMPVTATIIAFWFGTRGVNKKEEDTPEDKQKQKIGEGDEVQSPES